MAGIGKNQLFLSPTQQTCTCVFLLCQTPSGQGWKENTTQGRVQTENRQIFTAVLQKFTRCPQAGLCFCCICVTINLISAPDLLQSTPEPASGLMGRVLVEGCRRHGRGSPLHHVLARVSVCQSFPAYETETTACLDALTGPRGEG